MEDLQCLICWTPVDPLVLQKTTKEPWDSGKIESATLRCLLGVSAAEKITTAFHSYADFRENGIYCKECRKVNDEIAFLYSQLDKLESKLRSFKFRVSGVFRTKVTSFAELITNTQTFNLGPLKVYHDLRLELGKAYIPVEYQILPDPSVSVAAEQATRAVADDDDWGSAFVPEIDWGEEDPGDEITATSHDVTSTPSTSAPEPQESPPILAEALPHAKLTPQEVVARKKQRQEFENSLKKKFSITKTCSVRVERISAELEAKHGLDVKRDLKCPFDYCRFYSGQTFTLKERDEHLGKEHNFKDDEVRLMNVITKAIAPRSSNKKLPNLDENGEPLRRGKYKRVKKHQPVESDEEVEEPAVITLVDDEDHASEEAQETLQDNHDADDYTMNEPEPQPKKHCRKSDLKLKCPFEACDHLTFKSYNARRKHMKDDHEGEQLPNPPARTVSKLAKKVLPCRGYKCLLKFTSEIDLDEHVAEAHGEGWFKCNECERTFPLQSLLEAHEISKHTTPVDGLLTCKRCGKQYTTQFGLVRHMSDHDENMWLKCPMCEAKFKSVSGRQYHLKTYHIKQKTHPCDRCEKSFYTGWKLKLHKKAIHDKIKDALCNLCGKAFVFNGALRIHMVHSHGAQKTKGFISRIVPDNPQEPGDTIEADMEKATEGDKKKKKKRGNNIPYICEVCGMVFATNNGLYSHRAHHEADKRFRCEMCGAEFLRQSGLKYHVHALHLKSFDHKCETCGKAFLTPHKRDMHYRTVHLKEKNFICEVCNRSFGTSSNIRAHMVKVHGAVTYKKGPMPRYSKRPDGVIERDDSDESSNSGDQYRANGSMATANAPINLSHAFGSQAAADAAVTVIQGPSHSQVPIPGTSQGYQNPLHQSMMSQTAQVFNNYQNLVPNLMQSLSAYAYQHQQQHRQ